MRIRTPIFVAFLLSCAASAYLGLIKTDIISGGHDKIAHLVAFFVLTLLFYWSIDTVRKRAVTLTFNVCTLAASLGSEVIQHFATSGERKFDIYDVAANIVGSSIALILSFLYHGRLLARRKQQRYDRIRQDVEGAADEHELESIAGEAEAEHQQE